jgi:hypothetical protein
MTPQKASSTSPNGPQSEQPDCSPPPPAPPPLPPLPAPLPPRPATLPLLPLSPQPDTPPDTPTATTNDHIEIQLLARTMPRYRVRRFGDGL